MKVELVLQGRAGGRGAERGAALGEPRDRLQLVKVSSQAMEAEGQQRAQVEGLGWDWQEGALLTPGGCLGLGPVEPWDESASWPLRLAMSSPPPAPPALEDGHGSPG